MWQDPPGRGAHTPAETGPEDEESSGGPTKTEFLYPHERRALAASATESKDEEPDRR